MITTPEKSPEMNSASPSSTNSSAVSKRKTTTKMGYKKADDAKTEQVVLNPDGTIDTMALSQSQMRFISKYIKSNGIVSYACKLARISRDTYYRWLAENKTFEALIQRANEEPLDLVRLKLWEQIQKGNINAITLYLRAHDKAYSDRSLQISGKLELSPSWYEDMKPKKAIAARVIQTSLGNQELKKLDQAIESEDTKGINRILKEANDKKSDSQEREIVAESVATEQLGDHPSLDGTIEEDAPESAERVHPGGES